MYVIPSKDLEYKHLRVLWFSSLIHLLNVNEPSHEKMCLVSTANNKGADQPAHSRSLISAFVVHCIDSLISLGSIAEISRL